ncbi:hypothetical protein M8J76_002110 [Diaphorina citri]|nr:hypothetical protein M8J75_001749 [Diaphorina citri]KAI5729402.1 hypothetical protein M8J76_002110 [Diaphorina citri]
MTFEDPFFVVKEEVSKAINKTRSLYKRWLELKEETYASNILRDELEWTTTELRNSLRSIEWDLEDLEDTISIVERNPSKFSIGNRDLASRKLFIDHTREEVKCMKDTMNYSREKDRGGDHMSSKPLLSDDFHSPSPVKISAPFGSSRQTKYSKLNNQMDSPNRSWLSNSINQQSAMFDQQDSQLDMLSETIGTLKTVSRHIGSELDEQAVMLDEMDRGQWMAILILSALLFVILILFIIL